jgi:hypothetical protein
MTHHYALDVKCGVVEFDLVGKMGLLLTWKKDNSLRDDPKIYVWWSLLLSLVG